jgi:hypothetical protein
MPTTTREVETRPMPNPKILPSSPPPKKLPLQRQK